MDLSVSTTANTEDSSSSSEHNQGGSQSKGVAQGIVLPRRRSSTSRRRKSVDFVQDAAREKSDNLFHELDTKEIDSLGRDGIAKFVASNDKLWFLLSISLDRTDEECQEVVTDVVMELASNLQGPDALEAQISNDQFHQFREKYIIDPQGSQEFFHRALFAAFDVDCNSVLDQGELEKFMDTLYYSGDVFLGDVKLPPRDELLTVMLTELGSGSPETSRLTFDVVYHLIKDYKRKQANEATKVDTENDPKSTTDDEDKDEEEQPSKTDEEDKKSYSSAEEASTAEGNQEAGTADDVSMARDKSIREALAYLDDTSTDMPHNKAEASMEDTDKTDEESASDKENGDKQDAVHDEETPKKETTDGKVPNERKSFSDGKGRHGSHPTNQLPALYVEALLAAKRAAEMNGMPKTQRRGLIGWLVARLRPRKAPQGGEGQLVVAQQPACIIL